MRRTWRKAKPKNEKRFRVNQQIRLPEIFLIDENGENVGLIETSEALRRAEEAGFDLVEVNPKANPPIVKIMDFGQFKYEREKKAHKQKQQQKKVDVKGIRLSVRISEHDFNLRIEKGIQFLQKGHKLKIELMLKGREKSHPQKAVELIGNFVKKLEENDQINVNREQDLTKQGGKFIMILANKKD